MSYLIQASSLTKLFMREYERLCEEYPEFVKTPWDHPLAGKKTDDGEEVPQRRFKVFVPRSMGGITMVHNTPMHISKLVPDQKNRKKDEQSTNEAKNLENWLAGDEDGRPTPETNIFGIVRLNVDLDVSSAIVDIADLAENNQKTAEKEYKDLRMELLERTKGAVKEAKKIADEKVMGEIRVTYRNLKTTYDNMKAEGKGTYAPSVAEYVGAFILSDEISRASETRRKAFDNMDKFINSTGMVE